MQTGALALTVSTVVLTQSRGAWAALAVGLAGFGLIYSPVVRRGLAVAALGAGLTVVAVGPGRVAALVLGLVGFGLERGAISRMELWGRAVAAISDFPFTGVGMNMFRHVVPVLYPTMLAVADEHRDVVHAHDQFLQVALDLGLPGLIAYLAMWFGTGRLLVAAHAVAATTADRRILVGLAMGLLAHALFGVTDAIALGAKIGLLFWLMLAFVVQTCVTILTGLTAPGQATLAHPVARVPG